MHYEMELAEGEGYVIATLWGTRTPEAIIDATPKVVQYCRERSIFRILVDVREMAGRLDTLETYDVAGRQLPSQAGVRQLIQTALLDLTDNLERIHFFETVATNRGMMFKVFDDRDEALRWLLADND